MTNNEKMFLKLLSAALFNDKKYIDGFDYNVDWKAIYDEAFNQSVVSLVYESVCLLNNKPDDEIMLEWEEESMISVMKNSAIMYEHKALLNIMEENNIKCGIIKGASAAVNYPKPDLRSMGDIDILVKEENFAKAKALLTDNGYVENVYNQLGHEVSFNKNNVEIELHLAAPGIPDGKLGEKINKETQKIPDNCVTGSVGGIAFPKPVTRLNGLILILHVISHIGSGIGIRQIADWAVFVNNELTKEVWTNELQPMLREYKIYHFAKILTKMCVKYLGLPEEKCRWCMSADDRACDEFIKNIFSDGNFGRKSEGRNNSAKLLIANDTEKGTGFLPLRLFYSLHNAGLSAWPLARRNKLAAVFAWTYVPLRFIKRLFKGERTFDELYTIIGSAKKRYPLIKKLKIFK